MNSAAQLGHLLRDARIAAGLTQADLGEFAGGMDRHAVAAIERGDVTRQLERLLAMINVMGLEVDLVPQAVRRARPS